MIDKLDEIMVLEESKEELEDMPAICTFCVHCEELYRYEEGDYEDTGAWCNCFDFGMDEEEYEESKKCSEFELDDALIDNYNDWLEELK